MQGESVVEEWDGEVNGSASSWVQVYAAGAEVGLPARHHSHHAIKFPTYVKSEWERFLYSNVHH